MIGLILAGVIEIIVRVIVKFSFYWDSGIVAEMGSVQIAVNPGLLSFV